VAHAGVSADAAELQRRFDLVRARHGEVYAIVAPPRTASTALARILWNHPEVGFYCHEPFEATWYQHAPRERAADLLEAPEPVADLGGRGAGQRLVVKEMTFQVGDAFPLLAGIATHPIVFLIRDPRLTVASRMKVLRRSGRPEVFPVRESGWEDLKRQLGHVRREGIPHLIVDSSDLRAAPERVVPPLLERLGLGFSPELLTWESSSATGLSSVSGAEDPFYQRVLDSTGLEAPAETVPDLGHFPADGGFRDHVAECVAQYEALRTMTGHLSPHSDAR
jgi:Sulfotransferase domain